MAIEETGKPKPPKRRIETNGIKLTDEENERYLRRVGHGQARKFLLRFLAETNLHLRGRHDGPNNSGTEPCGYIFITQDSFNKMHAPILHIDLRGEMPSLVICFRKWKGILPFASRKWGDPKINMKPFLVNTEIHLQETIELAKTARDTFSQQFNLSYDLNK